MVRNPQPGDKPSHTLGLKHKGTKSARRLLKRLAQREFADQCKFSEAEMAMLNQIAGGRPPRNAQTIMKAMDMKASYAYSKPKQEIALSGSALQPIAVTFRFIDGVGKDGKPSE